MGTSEETQESPQNAPGRPGPHGPPRACQHAPSTSGWLPVNDYDTMLVALAFACESLGSFASIITYLSKPT